VASSPIEMLPFESFEGGVNLADAAHEIADNEARYLQDIFVNEPGLTTRRGPVKPVSGSATFTLRTIGMVAAQNPRTDTRVAVVEGGGSNGFVSVLADDGTSKTQLTWGGNFSNSISYILDAKPALAGGALIGTSSRYDATDSANQLIGYWAGARKANYSTGTMTSTLSSTAVTGSGTSWSTNLEPGMFLFKSTGEFIGTVKVVTSNTALTLTDKALFGGAAMSYTAKSLRGLGRRIATGRITCDSASTAVTGTNTKFRYWGLSSGTWDFFRQSDMKFIGTITGTSGNLGATLTSNATASMDNERYVLVQRDSTYAFDTTTAGVGFITAVYAHRQFYANRADHQDIDRFWYSEELDFEAIDTAPADGSFVRVKSGDSKKHSSPIKAMVPANNSLLILKENETFALFGDQPESFEIRRISDDGVLCGMSAVPYNEGVLYAGRDAIYFYDGVEAQNISKDKLGEFYKQCVKTFDPETYRMWGMVERDHYFLHIEHITSPVNTVRKNTVTTPTRVTIVIYLPTNAYTFFTNVDFRGHANMPATSALGMWYVVNDSSAHANICSISDLFDSTGLDTITCEGNTAGPRWYVESKRLSASEQVRKKLWKQLTAHYITNGDSLTVDVIPGLDNPGIASSVVLPNTHGLWQPKRVKFLKRAHHLGLRMYETTPVTSTVVQLGPFAIAFKRMRPQKV